ncbi:carboxylesterase/lipase family protein [Phenylobacterium sp.]|jgi:para-nitrobenzyl esterase|uniref:carboxylesterase/lipase family protein n=1 Tax=Phenylobacterium sp. TaxID=1871053 RepID=UPI002F925A1D
MKTVAGLASALILIAGGASAAEPPRAVIDTGRLVGASQNGVNVFKGIPFAQPPVGVLRWKPPQTPARWQGVRDATQFQLPCPQPINADGRANGGGVSGATSEDCLYLNVWVPPNAKNAPVMLWLYGGAGYLGGAHLGAYNGTSFARDGVILVTANYRLGALGGFAHPALTKAAAPNEPLGSYALMDAVAALQWIQRNIKAFGGDAKNVTLFGQSAGGAMVTSLLSVPSAKGLYHKAVIHSGAALRPGQSLADAEAAGAKIAEAVGLPGAAATVEQLRAVPADKFVTTQAARSGTGAVVDGRFRTMATVDALKAGTEIDVPLIVGTNNGEGGQEPALAVVQQAADGAPSFLYQFAYVPAWRKTEQPNGAPHSAEIPYVFASLNTAATGGLSRVTDHDRAVSERIHSCWVAFAKAKPVGNSIPCAGGFSWPAYTASGDQVAVFGEAPAVQAAAKLPKYVPPRPAQAAAR